MQVRKRNGQLEDVSFDKILRRIDLLKKGQINILGISLPSLDVDPVVVAQKVVPRLYNEITTSALDEEAAEVCVYSSTVKLDYGELGSRVIISNNHKNTKAVFSECVHELCHYLDEDVVKFIMKNKERLDQEIQHERDYGYDYFGFKTLERSYLLRVNDKTVERIQYMWMRVCCGIHYPSVEEVVKSYHLMSQRYFTHATPTLFNAGTRSHQLLSCFLTAPEDSINGIFKWISDLAKISKQAGGIGGSISGIRGSGARIRGTNSTSSGVIPMLKVVNDTMKYVNQGGRRAGSAAIYLQPHHPDIEHFLELTLNSGNEDMRARDLFTALTIPDLFMERVQNDEMWSLFDHHTCPELEDAIGDEYKRWYEKYEREGKAVNKDRPIKAQEIWQKMIRSQIEKGVPYMLYKDASNKKSNQQNLGTIKGSNLCIEILEYHDDKEYACCCLGSICLPRFVLDENTFDFDNLVEVSGQLVRNLNEVIDRNLYPVPETEISNKRHRPLGIGVQGLADVYIQMKMPFESDQASALNKEIFAAIYYGAMKASMEMAKQDGAYETFKNSPLSQGKFQFDLWGVDPSPRWDWESLRQDVITHGVRNSLLTACMPTASTSQIQGNNECIEPYTSNLYVRRTLSGDFIVANKHLIRSLMKLGLWNVDMKDEIVAHNGSIQHIDGIPQDLKDLFKTAWEIKQKTLIDQSADRGPYICQTQSLNLFFEDPTYRKLTSAHFYSWGRGLKTGSYYIRSRPKVQAQQFTIDPEKVKQAQQKNALEEEKKRKKVECTGDVCTMCSA